MSPLGKGVAEPPSPQRIGEVRRQATRPVPQWFDPCLRLIDAFPPSSVYGVGEVQLEQGSTDDHHQVIDRPATRRPRPRGVLESDYVSRLPETRPEARGTVVSFDPSHATTDRLSARRAERVLEQLTRHRSASADSCSSGSLRLDWVDASGSETEFEGVGCCNCRLSPHFPEIPMFHGDQAEWPSFYFTFRQLSNDMKWSNPQRKQHLLQSLRGKAASYILSKPHTTRYSFW